jgi:hypothetical protein
MRQQFRLGLNGVRKLRLQHLGDTLMVRLPCAPQPRLIRRVLDQRVLEDVRRLRRQPLLVQALRRYQLVPPLPQGRLVPRRDGP